jgi:hypothetical protein
MSNELKAIQSQGGIISVAIDSLVDQILKNADDGQEPTSEQIEAVIKLQLSAQNIDRAAIYWHRQKKTFVKLGYASFEDFGKTVFDYEKAYLHQQANAYLIEKSLGQSAIADSKQIAETHLRPLSPIPENERAAIWEEANRKAEELGKERTAKMVQDVVNEWKLKNEALQNDLMAKVQRLDDLDKKVNFQKLTVDEVEKQNDDLRNQLAFKVNEQVEARLAEERAMLILENQQAIAENKRLAENAQHELERLKREQEKAIADGVTLELNKLDTEMKQKRYQVECYERDLTDLKKVKSELDAEVGALAVHKETIKNIKEHLSFLTVSFTDAFDTACIPAEVLIEWESIHYALSKVQKQLATFLAENRESAKAIEGELVEIETPLDDENVEAFA